MVISEKSYIEIFSLEGKKMKGYFSPNIQLPLNPDIKFFAVFSLHYSSCLVPISLYKGHKYKFFKLPMRKFCLLTQTRST